MFPNAKVSCALFKGTTADEFIDQKEFSGDICLQAEEAYNFVLRCINKNAHVEGVYTVSRWEYPIKAIREVIRNAVVHRQYSLTGKDIKIAVYDDMVEITSPGLLPPTIDYADMTSRQSDARNKIIAPVFRRMNIIDQWGNGLKLISDELQAYPEIDFVWREVGMSFQVQFVKKNVGANVGDSSINVGDSDMNVGDSGINVGDKGIDVRDIDVGDSVICAIENNPKASAKDIAKTLGVSSRQIERIIAKLKAEGILSRVGTKKGYWIINKKR
jgi:predicted HTH transcriptional regulator